MKTRTREYEASLAKGKKPKKARKNKFTQTPNKKDTCDRSKGTTITSTKVMNK